MARLNHTIVWSSDETKSARFFADIFGRPTPVRSWNFEVVEFDGGVSLDFARSAAPIQSQHYAFLVDESEFDAIFRRIVELRLEYWADPMRRRAGEINFNDDGRGIYFLAPDGHFLEAITRPYGSGAR